MKNGINKTKCLLLEIVGVFLLVIIFVLVLDYFNIFNFITKNLNFNFLSILINSLLVIFIFLITYILVERKTFDIQEDIHSKKIKVLISLLIVIYNKCLDNIKVLENQEVLEKYIIPKCNFNSTNDEFVNNFKSCPFDFESRVIDLIQTGIVGIDFLDSYLNIKDLYRKYVDMRITFFNIKNSEKENHKEIAYLIDVDKNDLKRKLALEINKLLNIKKTLIK